MRLQDLWCYIFSYGPKSSLLRVPMCTFVCAIMAFKTFSTKWPKATSIALVLMLLFTDQHQVLRTCGPRTIGVALHSKDSTGPWSNTSTQDLRVWPPWILYLDLVTGTSQGDWWCTNLCQDWSSYGKLVAVAHGRGIPWCWVFVWTSNYVLLIACNMPSAPILTLVFFQFFCNLLLFYHGSHHW